MHRLSHHSPKQGNHQSQQHPCPLRLALSGIVSDRLSLLPPLSDIGQERALFGIVLVTPTTFNPLLSLNIIRHPPCPPRWCHQYGMMVRCHGEQEFLSALSGFHSWRRCLRLEAYGYSLPECTRAHLERSDEHAPTGEAVKAPQTRELESRRIQVEAMRRQYQVSGTLTVPQTTKHTVAHSARSRSPENPFA